MAEQVVDIRERIEKMRTKIYDKPQNIDLDSKNKVEVANVASKQSFIEKSSSKKELFENKTGKIPNSDKNSVKVTTYDETIKKNDAEENSEKKFFKSAAEKIPLKNDDIEKNESKTNKKSFENYHLENTVKEDNKEFNLKDQKQPFPQFSLNVNNPISWKLMLLIMLMQLLTNIMLVVVLYLK